MEKKNTKPLRRYIRQAKPPSLFLANSRKKETNRKTEDKMWSCALIKDVSEEGTMHSVESISQHLLLFTSTRLFIYYEVHL